MPAEEVVDVRDFLSGTAQPAATQAPVTPSDPRSKVYPRTVPISAKYLDPETGDVRTLNLVSTVPGFAGKNRIAAIEANLCRESGNAEFRLLSPSAAARIRNLARVSVQVVDVPREFMNYLGVDSDALATLAQQLEFHEFAFFRPGALESGATQSVTGLVLASQLDTWGSTPG